MTRVIFVVDFCHLVGDQKQNGLWPVQRFFFRKRRPKVTIFWGKQKLNLPHLDHIRFLYVASVMWGLGYNLLSSLTCSQIWLSSLVDDCQFTNLTKVEEKKRKKKYSAKFWWYFRKIKKSLLCVGNCGNLWWFFFIKKENYDRIIFFHNSFHKMAKISPKKNHSLGLLCHNKGFCQQPIPSDFLWCGFPICLFVFLHLHKHHLPKSPLLWVHFTGGIQSPVPIQLQVYVI